MGRWGNEDGGEWEAGGMWVVESRSGGQGTYAAHYVFVTREMSFAVLAAEDAVGV